MLLPKGLCILSFMKQGFCVYKNLGETPLETLERARAERGISPETPMTYAGRLDPMAEGLLLILVGDACKDKEKYTSLSKTYEFEILTGVATDTYDVLGLITEQDSSKKIEPQAISEFLESQKGTIQQNYPPFSSKTVAGKQLHQHAREGSHPEVSHEVSLFEYTFLNERLISVEDVLKTILERVDLVHGDFRQTEIKNRWKQVFATETEPRTISTWRVRVSSGFYIRELVHDISMHFNIPLVAFRIKRIEIESIESLLNSN